MFRVHHGLAGGTDAPDVAAALAAAEMMLRAGLTNVLITRANAEVTGHTDYTDQREDGRVGTNVLEVAIMP